MTFRSRILWVASLLAMCMVCAGLTAAERPAPADVQTVEMFSAV